METLELALELRRADYGANGERLGFDLYPYTEDAVAAVKRSVLQWRFIDSVAGEDRRRRAARGAERKDAVRAYELVYAALGARLDDRRLVGLDVGTTGVKAIAIAAGRRRSSRAPRRRYPLSHARGRAGRSRIRRTGGARREAALAALGGGEVAGIGLSGQMHGLVASTRRSACSGRRSSGTTSAPAAECAEIEARVGLERLIALTGNRALTGFTAPKLLWLRRHEPDVYARDRAHPAAQGLRAPAADRRAGRSTSPTRPARCCSTSPRRALERRGAATRSSSPREWLPPRSSRRARTCRRRAVAAGAGDQAAAALGVGVDRAGAALGRRSGPRASCFAPLPAYAADAAGARARLLPRRARHLARDGRDALRGRLAALAPRRRSRRTSPSTSSSRRRRRGRRAPRACSSCPTSPASARRTPTPTRAARSSGLSLRHDRGALVRAVLEGVAFGLRDSLELLARARRRRRDAAASRAAARAAGSGSRSSPRCSELPLELTAVEEGSAYGAALLARRRRRRLRGRRGGGRRLRPRPRARSSRDADWRGRVRRGLRSLPRAVPGAPKTLEGRSALSARDRLDRRHQPRRILAGAHASPKVDARRRREPRRRPGRRVRARSGRSRARTAPTRRCSRTRTSTRSTSRCRTRCTASGRSGRSRPASTCSARSRSAGDPDDVERGVRRRRACRAASHRGVHVPAQPADRDGSSSSSVTARSASFASSARPSATRLYDAANIRAAHRTSRAAA